MLDCLFYKEKWRRKDLAVRLFCLTHSPLQAALHDNKKSGLAFGIRLPQKVAMGTSVWPLRLYLHNLVRRAEFVLLTTVSYSAICRTQGLKQITAGRRTWG